MLLALSSGTLLLLFGFALNPSCSVDDDGIDSLHGVSGALVDPVLHKLKSLCQVGSDDDSFSAASMPQCSHIEQLDEGTRTAVFFVQLHARSMHNNVEGSGHGEIGKPSSFASMHKNRTITHQPIGPSLNDSVHDHTLGTASNASLHASLLDVPPATHFPRKSAWNAFSARDLDLRSMFSDGSSGPDWWLALPLVVLVFALIGAYYSWGSKRNASEEAGSNIAESGVPNAQHPSNSNHRTPEDVVQDLGFGWAQFKIFLLADGIAFLDGWELGLAGIVATSTAADLDLNVYGRAMLASMVAIGIIPGSLLGGWLGDHFGRKPPILISYVCMAASAFGTYLAPTGAWVLALRGFMGAAVGIGLPTASTIISELSPVQWRMVMFSLRGVLFTTGYFIANVTCWILDPTLEAVNWRLAFVITIPFMFAFCIPCALLLEESPIYLATIGDHGRAQLGFERMRQLNACPEVSISYTVQSDDSLKDQTPTGSLNDHLSVIFGFGMLGCSLTLFLTSGAVGVFGTGHGYGLPRVLIEESDKHSMAPGAQMVIECLWGYVSAVLLFAFDGFLTRKQFLLLLDILLAAGFLLFAWSAHSDRKFWLVSLSTQASLGVLRMVLKMSHVLIGLVATECYPSALNAQGIGLVIACGRIGAIIAPLAFEWLHASFGLVTAFYYVCSGIAVANFIAILGMLPDDLETARIAGAENLSIILSKTAARRAETSLS